MKSKTKRALSGRGKNSRGNPTDSAGNEILPSPSCGVPLKPDQPPNEIRDDDIACDEWSRIINLTSKYKGWFEATDSTVLMMYCVTFSKYINAYKTEKDLSRIQNDMLKILDVLGFTPKHRGKIDIGEPASDKLNRAEAFLKKKNGE